MKIGRVGLAVYGLRPLAVQAYRKTYPDVWTNLLPLNNQDLLKKLVQRQVDVAISRSDLKDSSFKSRMMFREPLVLVVPEASGSDAKATVSLDTLGGQRFTQDVDTALGLLRRCFLG